MHKTPDKAKLALQALQDIVDGREFVQCLATWDSFSKECRIENECLGCKAQRVLDSLKHQRDELIMEINSITLTKNKLIKSDRENASL